MAYVIHRGDGFGFGEADRVLDCTAAGCSRQIWEGGPYCRRHAEETRSNLTCDLCGRSVHSDCCLQTNPANGGDR